MESYVELVDRTRTSLSEAINRDSARVATEYLFFNELTIRNDIRDGIWSMRLAVGHGNVPYRSIRLRYVESVQVLSEQLLEKRYVFNINGNEIQIQLWS